MASSEPNTAITMLSMFNLLKGSVMLSPNDAAKRPGYGVRLSRWLADALDGLSVQSHTISRFSRKAVYSPSLTAVP